MLKVPITAICQQCFRYCDYHKWMILVSNRTSPWAKSDIIFCLVWHAEHEYIDTTNWLSFRFRKVSTQKVTTNYVFIYFVIKINQLKKKKKQLKKREDKNDVLRSLLFECQRRWSSFIYSPNLFILSVSFISNIMILQMRWNLPSLVESDASDGSWC